MPLPIIVGGIALVAGAAGLVTGAKGAKKIADAKSRVNEADEKYENSKSLLNETEMKTTNQLDILGALKVQVWKDFERFSNAFEKIHNRPDFEEKISGEFTMPKHALIEIKQVQIKAIEIIGTTMASAGAGAVTGMAAYSGVLALGTASTGTAISSLSGVAATNAALAALGGGSIASGGGGIALGTQILTGAVAGPIIAVGGLLLNAKGNSSLDKAEEAEREVEKIVSVINKSVQFLKKVTLLAKNFEKELSIIHNVYLKEVSKLEALVAYKNDYDNYSFEERLIVDNNIKLVSILFKLSTQDLITPAEKEDQLPTVLVEEVNEVISLSKEAVKNI